MTGLPDDINTEVPAWRKAAESCAPANMKHHFGYFLLILTLVSCKATERSLDGTYRHRYDSEISSNLFLHRDSTYVFSQQAGLVLFRSVGKWTVMNDTIYLNCEQSAIDNGTHIGNQKYAFKAGVLLEIVNGKPSGLKMKRK